MILEKGYPDFRVEYTCEKSGLPHQELDGPVGLLWILPQPWPHRLKNTAVILEKAWPGFRVEDTKGELHAQLETVLVLDRLVGKPWANEPCQHCGPAPSMTPHASFALWGHGQ